MTCTSCGAQMVANYRWYGDSTRRPPRAPMTTEEREDARADGLVPGRNGTTCMACYCAERRGGRKQRDPVPAEVVVEEWKLLVDRTRSTGENIRLIAPRVGMSPGALEHAIRRAKRRGLLERAA